MKSKTPVSVMWESTIACGLRCKHCKASAKTRPDPDELTTEEGFDLINQIASYGAPFPILRITGGNALMRGDIFDLIKYGKEKGLTVTIAPSTTPLLNRENIERLKDSGCDTVAVSIDGPDAGTHDRFRGVPGTFDRLVEAASIMREIGLPFRLLTTVSKFNVEHLPEIMDLSKDLGAAGWYLYMLIPTGRARQEYEITPEEFEDVFHFVYDLMMQAPMTINAIAGSEPYRRVAVTRRLVEMGRLDPSVLKKGPLYARLKEKLDRIVGDKAPAEPAKSTYKPKDKKRFGKGIFISNNGDVFPSSFLPIRLGNVREDALSDVYSGATILEEMHDASRLKGRCGSCEFNHICRGSRSRAYAVTGDYLAEDPYCAYQPGTVAREDVEDAEAILDEIRLTNFSRRVR
jgi:radical SAM protein